MGPRKDLRFVLLIILSPLLASASAEAALEKKKTGPSPLPFPFTCFRI